MKAKDLRNGTTFDLNGFIMQVIEFEFKENSTIIVKAKNLLKNKFETLEMDENATLETAYIDKTEAIFDYKDDDNHYFYNDYTFDEYAIKNEYISKQFKYVKNGIRCTLLSYKGDFFDASLPRLVYLKVTAVNNGIATLENGMKFQVPSYVKVNDEVSIDTILDAFYN